MSRLICLFPVLTVLALLAGCNSEPLTQAPPPAPVAPVIRDGSLMAPGRPQLAVLPATVSPGTQAVQWNMWWGENGQRWSLSVNGRPAAGGTLAAATPHQQQGAAEVALARPGRYEIKVTLCNDHGCSESLPALVDVLPPAPATPAVAATAVAGAAS